MAAPGWPLPAAWTPSIDKVRIVLMASSVTWSSVIFSTVVILYQP